MTDCAMKGGSRRVRKAVIPVAGFGTRFLPITKTTPKEMLPIIDKPVVQYVVEEAVAAGLDDILFVISKGKSTLEDYFDRAPELEAELERKGKTEALAAVRGASSLARVHFVRQKTMRGLGDAILHAADHVGEEPFVVLLGDTATRPSPGRPPVAAQLVEAYRRHGGAVVAVERVPREKISRYGIIDGAPVDGDERVLRVRGLVEKPAPEDAPTDLAVALRYLLTPEVFDFIRQTEPGKGGEIQITDALRALAAAQPFFACRVEGERFDAGDKLEFLKTNVRFALDRPDLREKFAAFLRTLDLN